MSDSESDESSREIDYPDHSDVDWEDEDSDVSPERPISPMVATRVAPQPMLAHIKRRKPFIEFHAVSTPNDIVPMRVREECAVCLEKLHVATIQKPIVYCRHSCGNPFHDECVRGLHRCPMCRYACMG